MKRRILTLALLVLLVMGAICTSMTDTSAVTFDSGPSASGHGAILLESGEMRQFSFNAVQHRDGTISGNAVIHNPGFDFRSHINITCLIVDGNRASLGGTVKSTNDPALDGDRAFFTVFDNGEPGKDNDTISLVFFDEQVGPEACQFIGPSDFPQIPIDAGNVQVMP
jgi:hypothetical protein